MFDEGEDVEIDREYEELCEAQRRAVRGRDWIARLFESQGPEPERKSDPVDAYLQAVLERARHEVTQLQEEIEVRRELHSQALGELDYEIAAAAHALSRYAYGGLGYNVGVDRKRAQLEERLDALRREKRSWRVRVWKDLLDLRAALRSARREYEAAERRSSLRFG